MKTPMETRMTIKSNGWKLANAIFVATKEAPQRKTAATQAMMADLRSENDNNLINNSIEKE